MERFGEGKSDKPNVVLEGRTVAKNTTFTGNPVPKRSEMTISIEMHRAGGRWMRVPCRSPYMKRRDEMSPMSELGDACVGWEE